MNSKVENRRKFILEGNLWKVIFLLALPIALNSTVFSLFSLFDAIFTSHIGADELSAVSLVTPITQLVNSIGAGLTVAGVALIAKHIALKETEKVKQTLGQLIILALFVSFIIFIYGTMNATRIVEASGAKGSMRESAIYYFSLTMFVVPLMFLTAIHDSLRSAEGNASFVVAMSLIQVVLKFTLNFIFIIVLEMGLLGLGLASILSVGTSAIVAIYFIFIKKNQHRIGLKHLIINKTIILAILITSIPIVIQKSTNSFGHIYMSRFAMEFGDEVLKGYALTNKINTTAFTTVTGIGVGLVPIISQNMAVGNISRVKEAFKKALILALVTALVLYGIIMSLHVFLADVLTGGNDPVTKGHIIDAVRVYSITVIPWAIFQVTTGVYQGMRKNKYPLIISLLRLWVFRISVLWVLIYKFEFNQFSIWNVMLFSNFLGMITALVILKFIGIKPHKDNKIER